MKLLTAIVGPDHLEAIEALLPAHEACLVTVGQVIGYGMEPAQVSIYRGATHQVRQTKLRLEILVDDMQSDRLVELIAEAGATGRSVDGAIFVTPLAECIGIGRRPRQTA